MKKISLLNGKSSVVLLSIIFISAISLSLISYQYSNSVSQEILDIARQDTASNAKIQARSVSLLLEHQLEAVNSNLESSCTPPTLDWSRRHLIYRNSQFATFYTRYN